MLPDESDENADFPGSGAIEQAFVIAAAGKLPLEHAEVYENLYGVRCYRWPSPSETVGALTASIHEGEITLGTKIFHDHVDAHCFEVFSQHPDRDRLAACIATAAVQLAGEIMRGERIFSISCDETGRVVSHGMSPRDVWKQRLGKAHWHPASERFWDWQGEVFRD